jgi:hypothetical protein
MKLALAFVLAVASPLSGQNVITPGSKVLVRSQDATFAKLISEQIVKQKIPVVLVTDIADADYVAATLIAPPTAYTDPYRGSVMLKSVKTHAIVWESHYDAGWGMRELAGQIVHQMKKDLFQEEGKH